MANFKTSFFYLCIRGKKNHPLTLTSLTSKQFIEDKFPPWFLSETLVTSVVDFF
jgi:hypothetical protein